MALPLTVTQIQNALDCIGKTCWSFDPQAIETHKKDQKAARSVLEQAAQLGFLFNPSHTQFEWSELGLERAKELLPLDYYGLPCDIYRSSTHGEQPHNVLNGVSRCVVVGPNVPRIIEAYEGCPPVEIAQINWNGTSVFVRPYGETRHTMFGGAFIHTSDSRFVEVFGGDGRPIRIHDRIETR